jgi:hypothetical protein
MGREDIKNSTQKLAARLLLLGLLFSSSLVLGQDVPKPSADDHYVDSQYLKISRQLSIGVGVGFERFDTNFKFTEKSTGRTAYIDLEGTLGLPETDTVPMIYGYWRISKKHGLGFSYYQIKREASLLAIDENLGDLTITGDVTMADASRFYYFSYNYTAYHDDRTYVFWSLGLNAIDLKYRLDATGMIDFHGAPLVSNEYRQEVNQLAPLPMIGVDAWFAITPRWAYGAKLAYIGGSYKEISANILDIRVRAKYAFNKNVGFLFGFNSFLSNIEIDETDFFTDVNYAFSGFKIGLDVGF